MNEEAISYIMQKMSDTMGIPLLFDTDMKEELSFDKNRIIIRDKLEFIRLFSLMNNSTNWNLSSFTIIFTHTDPFLYELPVL